MKFSITRYHRIGILFASLFFTQATQAEEKIEVKGRRYSWLESAQTASEGKIEKEQLKERAILRPGEIMESVPGLITTQHSGTGKANQYFLRGFNLDHGTDFATFVDGVPINMPSHGHGQGYTDVNFLIPEILHTLEYAKGPYSAEYGDFSGAGHIDMMTQDSFDHGLLKYTGGSFGYNRFLLLDTVPIMESTNLNYTFESTRYIGPWSDIHEDLYKTLGFLKLVQTGESSKTTVSLMHYDARWNSADHIPHRAVADGSLDRLGSIDKDTGGKTKRDSVSVIWEKKIASAASLRIQVYSINYALNLWSNPSYFMEDPIQGDQFEQVDRRSVYGASAKYSQDWTMGTIPGSLRVGLQERYDQVHKLGLYKTTARERTGELGVFAVEESQAGIFAEQEWHWTREFRSTLGVRHDQFQFKNTDKLLELTGREQAQLTSPKLSMSYRLLPGWQVFANAGQSFHSNDARGVTAQKINGNAASAAPGIVPVRGYELGSSYDWNDALRISIAAWRLQLDSELVYIGDAGTTEASRGSRRDGIDWLLQVAPDPLFHADLELSWARAVFTSDPDGEGDRVEGHLPFVAMIGFGSQVNKEWALSARMRHFGKRPLTADGSVESGATSLLNLHVAYEPEGWEFSLDALNALNSQEHDIDYFYESQLQGEADPVEDLHYHPVEPTVLRFSIGKRF